MALITCPECGKQVSELAEACPNCGFPIGFTGKKLEGKSEEPNEENNEHYSKKVNSFEKKIIEQPIRAYIHGTKKYSMFSIIALIFSILGFTFFLGIIFSAIDLRRKDGKKKTLSIVALCISIFWLIVVSTAGKDDDKGENGTISETENQIEEQEVLNEKKKSGLYKTEKLCTIAIGDIEIKIPEAFTENTRDNKEWKYYYYDDLMLATYLKEENDYTNESFVNGKDSFAYGMIKDNDGEIISNDELDISVGKSIYSIVDETINKKRYILYSVTFVYNKNMYCIGLAKGKDSELDYSEDFGCLIDSIQVNDNQMILKTEENGEHEINREGEKEEETIEYENVFFYNLMDNLDYYNGKYVRTVIQVSSCYQSEDRKYITSQYSDYDLVKNSASIKIYPDNYQDFERDEYITVEGRLAKDGNSDILTNAHIVNHGEDARKTFEKDLEICKEEYRKKLMSQRELFIESCVDVSYDDLRRYPDTYKDKPIKLKIYAEDVEPDGWIFKGDIIATYQGEELAVYDERIVREPRILEGDTITVYAVGYGLSKMQVKQKGLILDKTVDEYEVPAIQIKYTENDKEVYINTAESGETDSYEKGKDVGEDLKEKSDSVDWDENKENAREAGEKAAEWINDLIE